MLTPPQYGGRGADAVSYLRALARIGREGTGVRTFFSGHVSIGAYPILTWGTPEQKERYLPAACRGEKILAFGLTEPDAGSNPLEMTTTYERRGDKYVLNGVKYLISNGGIADAVICFGYPANPPAGSPRRVSAFIVDAKQPGFIAETLTAKMGMFAANTAMFELRDAVVPINNMLGAEGDGFRIAMGTLVSGRLSVAAGCLGVIEDCLEEINQLHEGAAATRQADREASADTGAYRCDRGPSRDDRGDRNESSGSERRGDDQSGRRRSSEAGRYSRGTSQALRGECGMGRGGPGRTSVRRPRLVNVVSAGPALDGRPRLPHLRRDRRNPQAQDRGKRVGEGIRSVQVTSATADSGTIAAPLPFRMVSGVVE